MLSHGRPLPSMHRQEEKRDACSNDEVFLIPPRAPSHRASYCRKNIQLFLTIVLRGT